MHYRKPPRADQKRGVYRGPGVSVPPLSLSPIHRVHRLELDPVSAKEILDRRARGSPGPPEKYHLGHTLYLPVSEPPRSRPGSGSPSISSLFQTTPQSRVVRRVYIEASTFPSHPGISP